MLNINASRIKILLSYLHKHYAISSNQARELLNVSAATIRRDFEYLDKSYGNIKREHGKLLYSIADEEELIFKLKATSQLDDKRKIAIAALPLIMPKSCILIDSGTTCHELAKLLPNIDLKVVTTDVNIAVELGQKSHVESYVIGGKIRPHYFTIGSSLATEMINMFSFDQAFISCDAISANKGITNITIDEVGVKKAIIKNAKEVILLADSTKIEKATTHLVCRLDKIKTIITNTEPDDNLVQRINELKIKLIVAGDDND